MKKLAIVFIILSVLFLIGCKADYSSQGLQPIPQQIQYGQGCGVSPADYQNNENNIINGGF